MSKNGPPGFSDQSWGQSWGYHFRQSHEDTGPSENGVRKVQNSSSHHGEDLGSLPQCFHATLLSQALFLPVNSSKSVINTQKNNDLRNYFPSTCKGEIIKRYRHLIDHQKSHGSSETLRDFRNFDQPVALSSPWLPAVAGNSPVRHGRGRREPRRSQEKGRNQWVRYG